MRSGSGIAAMLVEEAFGLDNLVDRRGARRPKHRLVSRGELRRLLRNNVALMINIKDPYAWIVSIHAWFHKGKHGQVRATPKKMPVTFGPHGLRQRLKKYMRKYGNWFQLPLDKRVIRYEDVLDDLDAVYRPISELLGVEPQRRREKLDAYVVVTPQRGPDPTYYTERHYLELLAADQTRQITDEVDWKLLEGLYTPVT